MFDRIKKLFDGDGNGQSTPPPQVPFEYLTIHGKDVVEEMRQAEMRSGVVPVLMGNREAFEGTVELIEENSTDFDEIREAGLKLNVEEWIKSRIEESPEYYEVEEGATGVVDTTPLFTPARDILSGKFEPEVFIGLIPVETHWLVPAYLKPGGWNECPEPEVQLAFFHRWHERYGARVVTVTSDIIEFAVSRPPATADEARDLAWEQFVYCADIVHQGVQTLGNLQATLINSPNWFFWWD